MLSPLARLARVTRRSLLELATGVGGSLRFRGDVRVKVSLGAPTSGVEGRGSLRVPGKLVSTSCFEPLRTFTVSTVLAVGFLGVVVRNLAMKVCAYCNNTLSEACID